MCWWGRSPYYEGIQVSTLLDEVHQLQKNLHNQIEKDRWQWISLSKPSSIDKLRRRLSFYEDIKGRGRNVLNDESDQCPWKTHTDKSDMDRFPANQIECFSNIETYADPFCRRLLIETP